MPTVFANGRSIVHKGDGQTDVSGPPDVCKTPSPGGPVPVPYVNVAKSSDLVDGTQTVEIEGNSVALGGSSLGTSTGDEPGSAGGIISSKTKGKLTWRTKSLDVIFEGEGVVRFGDVTLHNGNASNTVSVQRGNRKTSYPGGGGDIKCENCGKNFDDPTHRQLWSSDESFAEAIRAAPRWANNAARPMVAALTKEEGKKGKRRKANIVEIVSAVAGDAEHPLTPKSAEEFLKNFKYGTPINPISEGDKNAAGNCAEQKALYFASKKKLIPPIEGWSLSVIWQEEPGFFKHMPSCPTCKRVITSMLCENEPKTQRK